MSHSESTARRSLADLQHQMLMDLFEGQEPEPGSRSMLNHKRSRNLAAQWRTTRDQLGARFDDIFEEYRQIRPTPGPQDAVLFGRFLADQRRLSPPDVSLLLQAQMRESGHRIRLTLLGGFWMLGLILGQQPLVLQLLPAGWSHVVLLLPSTSAKSTKRGRSNEDSSSETQVLCSRNQGT